MQTASTIKTQLRRRAESMETLSLFFCRTVTPPRGLYLALPSAWGVVLEACTKKKLQCLYYRANSFKPQQSVPYACTQSSYCGEKGSLHQEVNIAAVNASQDPRLLCDALSLHLSCASFTSSHFISLMTCWACPLYSAQFARHIANKLSTLLNSTPRFPSSNRLSIPCTLVTFIWFWRVGNDDAPQVNRLVVMREIQNNHYFWLGRRRPQRNEDEVTELRITRL